MYIEFEELASSITKGLRVVINPASPTIVLVSKEPWLYMYITGDCWEVKDPWLYITWVCWDVKDPWLYIRGDCWDVKDPWLYITWVCWDVKDPWLYITGICWETIYNGGLLGCQVSVTIVDLLGCQGSLTIGDLFGCSAYTSFVGSYFDKIKTCWFEFFIPKEYLMGNFKDFRTVQKGNRHWSGNALP